MFNLLKQPRGFSVFFLSEMWERYGFYITQTLLIFYLIGHFHLTDSASYSILGSFTALAYVNPALGGYIADRYLGARLAILWGALLISFGYFIFTFADNLNYVFMSLAVIAIGTGLFKPNVSSLLGSLYAKKDTRRHTGYTIFYMGISLGIILATTFGGYLQQKMGWKITYIIAALVLLIAYITFFFGSRFFHFPDQPKIPHSLKKYLQAVFFIVITIMANSIIIAHQTLAIVAFSLIALLSVVVIGYERFRSKDRVEKRNLLAYLLLACVSVFFWAIYFQLFFSLNLFIERVVDRNIFNFKMPSSFFVSIESLGLIIFGPLLGALWRFLALKEKGISIPGKFAGGLCMMTLAFALLFMSSIFKNSQGLIMSSGIIAVYLIISIGELMVSPIGLAMVTELAPPRLSGLMMGIYFIPLGLGGKLAGAFADYAAISPDIVDLNQMETIYHHAFGFYLIACFVITLISFVLFRIIKKLISI
jgi:proton-dependent oligopeptide transporter, POT family